ncbi:ferredoxin [Hydrogenophaga sp. BPS33]|uniref:ferredoxin n=1 Tax=Hydrogenophaga sp. BPS33 TaxID=2651974 RepID=UPI00131FCD8C|nr:(4Fe-4S)-binding protein [Hydrogenophaga sp. BPS33]QHE84164.1 ferredoxin [Hydrogenophaga sp. BPS33]
MTPQAPSTPRPAIRLRLSANPDLCISAGLCVMASAEVFDQRDLDGAVQLRIAEPPEHLYAQAMAAVNSCPSGAITAEHIES